VSVTLNPISPGLKHLTLMLNAVAGTAHSFADVGFRVRNNGVIILPGDGSMDAGFSFDVQEQGWLALPDTVQPVDIDLNGMVLSGPPHNVTFDFYNSENHDHEVSIILTTTEPFHDIDDLIKEMHADRERLGRIEKMLARNEKLINPA
jgi:hypothetical protein